jgi:hypothetical protein
MATFVTLAEATVPVAPAVIEQTRPAGWLAIATVYAAPLANVAAPEKLVPAGTDTAVPLTVKPNVVLARMPAIEPPTENDEGVGAEEPEPEEPPPPPHAAKAAAATALAIHFAFFPMIDFRNAILVSLMIFGILAHAAYLIEWREFSSPPPSAKGKTLSLFDRF